MTDQLQAMLQQTGAATAAFPANSRYNRTPLASLTALEAIVYPTSAQLQSNGSFANFGIKGIS